MGTTKHVTVEPYSEVDATSGAGEWPAADHRVPEKFESAFDHPGVPLENHSAGTVLSSWRSRGFQICRTIGSPWAGRLVCVGCPSQDHSAGGFIDGNQFSYSSGGQESQANVGTGLVPSRPLLGSPLPVCSHGPLCVTVLIPSFYKVISPIGLGAA
jgi:hypothetical protein